VKKLISEIGGNLSALISLSEANLKTTVESTRLGWLWWIISPLLMMGVYYVFISIILDRGGENYHLFILTGLIAWNYFSSAFMGVAGVINQNSQLIKQVALPIPMLLMVPVLVQMVLAVFGVIVIMVWNFGALGIHTFLVIPLILLIGMTSYAFGLFLAVCTMYISDITQLLQYVLRMGFFLTPVLFSADRVLQNESLPEHIRNLYYLNPMVTLIDAFRVVLLDGRAFELSNVLFLLVCIVILIQIGLVWVRMNTPQIVKML
jgi:lipopolysaccharide transport system permease protein